MIEFRPYHLFVAEDSIALISFENLNISPRRLFQDEFVEIPCSFMCIKNKGCIHMCERLKKAVEVGATPFEASFPPSYSN
jgi:hypothetical protein